MSYMEILFMSTDKYTYVCLHLDADTSGEVLASSSHPSTSTEEKDGFTNVVSMNYWSSVTSCQSIVHITT